MVAPLLGLLGVGLGALGAHAAIKPAWERKQRRIDGREVAGLLADADGPDAQATALAGAGLLSPAEFMNYGNSQYNRAADFTNNIALEELRQAGAMDRTQATIAGQRELYGMESSQAALSSAFDLVQAGDALVAGGQFDVGAFTNALTNMESGGDYGVKGPERNGDHAYGKYQIMGANIPAWTQRYLGKEMTPDEFLASPEAQDAVYQGQMASLIQKHGPVNALSIWHSGVPLKEAIQQSRHDGNMSTRDYVSSVWSSYGRSAGQNQVAAQNEAIASTALLEAQDVARPYATVSDKVDRVQTGLENIARLGNNIAAPEAQAAIDQMALAGKELFFEWKNTVYGDTEAPPAVLEELEEIFRTPGGMLEDRERTSRFFQMMQVEAQTMAEYKSTRALVEKGVLPRSALRGMNGGRLSEEQRAQILLGTFGRPPGVVDANSPPPGTVSSPRFPQGAGAATPNVGRTGFGGQ